VTARPITTFFKSALQFFYINSIKRWMSLRASSGGGGGGAKVVTDELGFTISPPNVAVIEEHFLNKAAVVLQTKTQLIVHR
jgi:hypothetical protein